MRFSAMYAKVGKSGAYFFVAAANYKSNQIVLQGKGQERLLVKVAATTVYNVHNLNKKVNMS
jgi:hypothetical protein